MQRAWWNVWYPPRKWRWDEKTWDRLLKHVRVEDRGYETMCWIWTGTLGSDGYPRGYLRRWVPNTGGWTVIHRALYDCTVKALRPGQCVCHRCDQAACINPEHLWAGSHADNMRDMWEKRRQRMSASIAALARGAASCVTPTNREVRLV